MIYILNLLFISLLDEFSVYKALTELISQLNILWVLKFTIYIFIDKLEKKPSLQNKNDDHFNYQIYLEKDEKKSSIKDLKFFEEVFTKQKTSLLIYNAIAYVKNLFLSSQIQ